MVTIEQLAERKAAIAASQDLQVLLQHLEERALPLLTRLPPIPEAKALLSTDGGVCPDDRTALSFDPWSPESHGCATCGKAWSGERHHRYWARFQHLWLAERAAHLAALAAFGAPAVAGPAGGRAAEILGWYGSRYWSYPNRDNVLGPSRLFFSTYLESLWLSNYLAAASVLRAAGRLDDRLAVAVGQVADEAANVIGEFDEGFSNRQTWNDAALTAIAVWFEDHDLMERVVGGRTGLVGHLLEGFGSDGMWYEGENYHLFALRGLLTGLGWARAGGLDVLEHADLARRLEAALLAPVRTALPDGTFPARKDARFGVSLAQPMYLENWEVGLGLLGERGAGSGPALAGWLRARYQATPAPGELFESYLHDAPIAPLPAPRSRTTLSWWSLLTMRPELPQGAPPPPASVLLESQGLAVLRTGTDRYASLECGPLGGGHGHADRLHLTLHAHGAHWLPDFGTGSYVARDLFWYRATLAHNAPQLDGRPQAFGDATCEAFDASGDWSWARGRFGDVTRSVVSGPGVVIDLVELTGREERLLELPWHITGDVTLRTPGRWSQVEWETENEFIAAPEQFHPDAPGHLVWEATTPGARLTAHLLFDGDLLRATGPGRPEKGSATREPFYLARTRGRNLRVLTVLEPTDNPRIQAVSMQGDQIDITSADGVSVHRIESDGWAAGDVRLGGRRSPAAPFRPMLQLDQPEQATGVALRLDAPPALDGSLDGFDAGEPLLLDIEDQYRRSEEPFSGPEDFSAVAYAGWDDAMLYLAVEVTKPDLCFRPADAAPLLFDNEPDDIHSDGLQVYLKEPVGAGGVGEFTGFLIVPEPKGHAIRARMVGGGRGDESRSAAVHGAWERTDTGYRVTVGIPWPEWHMARVGTAIGFDLIVNEMLPGRERRAGQLVWSGGSGWVWLRGDRQDPDRTGVLELLG